MKKFETRKNDGSNAKHLNTLKNKCIIMKILVIMKNFSSYYIFLKTGLLLKSHNKLFVSLNLTSNQYILLNYKLYPE